MDFHAQAGKKMTIDTEQRIKIATAIQSYLDDKIDNFKLDDILSSIESEDLACVEIALEMSRFYDDFYSHLHSDRPLRPAYETGVRRWIRFLNSSSEWPLKHRFSANLGTKILQIAVSALKRKERTQFSVNPFWPFENEEAWERNLVEKNT